jgi:hypothetical protein
LNDCNYNLTRKAAGISALIARLLKFSKQGYPHLLKALGQLQRPFIICWKKINSLRFTALLQMSCGTFIMGARWKSYRFTVTTTLFSMYWEAIHYSFAQKIT